MGNRILAVLALAVVVPAACGRGDDTAVSRSNAGDDPLPAMRWDHRPEAEDWTRATLAAIDDHGSALVQTVPRDIASYCPGYADASDSDRAAFWSGMMSALAKHESTWKPEASGGDGRWIGLTQISPGTARGYGCKAQNTPALKDGSANLSCAVRIAAVQVPRDTALVSENGEWRGMARDWAPFRSAAKREDMAAWTSAQEYCAK